MNAGSSTPGHEEVAMEGDSAGTMRAAVLDRYGPPEVLRVATAPRPPARTGELLVRVLAAPVTSSDARVRGARFPPGFGVPARLAFGIRGPRRRILGGTFAGVVESVGAGVDRFGPADPVCGMTGTKMGTHAEFVAVRAGKVARVPAGVSAEDAAGVLFGGTAALYFLRDRASVAPGMSVLVNGASGAVGTNAVQLAKHLGAKVTGVTSGANAALVTGLGADEVIDHTTSDLAATNGRFDVVLDCVGNITIASGRLLLTEGGVLVLAVAGLWQTIRARGDVVAGSAPERVEDYETLLDLVASGALTVVHDSSFSLEDIAEAHRRVDSGHKRGNVIIRPCEGPRKVAP
jgi:NADPH:quinone reductase-like Zn-dependent oxidoreductase